MGFIATISAQLFSLHCPHIFVGSYIILLDIEIILFLNEINKLIFPALRIEF